MRNLTYLLATCLIVLMGSSLQAQCPPGENLTFGTMEDLQDFRADYPNCTEWDGNVYISISVPQGPIGGPGGGGSTPPGPNEDINLNALSNLTRINGTLILNGPFIGTDNLPPQFFNLAGLSGLEFVHELQIRNFPYLRNLTPLGTGLNEVDILEINDLPQLTSLPEEAFSVTESLILINNRSLSSFGGMELPTEMKHLILRSNNFGTETYDQFLPITKVEDLNIYDEAVASLGSEFSIEVTNNLTLGKLTSLTDVSGINVGTRLDRLNLAGFPAFLPGFENFSSLERIEEVLTLNEVQDLTFLPNVAHIEKIDLSQMEGVQSFTELPSLTSLGDILLWELPNLADFSGLSSVDYFGTRLTVNTTGITDLDGLNLNTDSLYFMEIYTNPNLTDISNLSGLTEIDIFRLLDNAQLSDLEGIHNLTRAISQISIGNLPLLQDLSDLNKLEYANFLDINDLNITDMSGIENLREIGGSLNIFRNPVLENLDALAGIEYIGNNTSLSTSFSIWDNTSLSSIEGLRELRGFIDGQFQIFGNPLLDNCSIEFVCSNISYAEAFFRIENNGDNCDSEQAIRDLCGFNYLEVFLDIDGNGIQDNGEPNISIGEIKVGDNYSFYPNNNGRVGFYLNENPGFIEYLPEENWEVTTANTFTETNNLLEVPALIKVGIRGTGNFVNVKSNLGHTTLVCDREHTITATVKNQGTQPVTANISITGAGTFIQAVPTPDDSTDDVFFYELGQLFPGETKVMRLSFRAPGVDEVDLGELLELTYLTEITDLAGEMTVDERTYTSVFRCGYDPNDKQVFPTGVQDENYTVFDEEEFEYLIRFQNTGNYPAQDITITDTLDLNLDTETFEFISASHEVSKIQREGNILEFTFKNIFLPDSISNEPASHGFVQFKINRKENLPEGTVISNTANIYFDFNPVIVTNTVFNTMVTEIPTSSNTQIAEGSKELLIYPNPTSGVVHILRDAQPLNEPWNLYDLAGRLMKSGTNSSLDLGYLDEGTYLFQLGTETKKIIVLHR